MARVRASICTVALCDIYSRWRRIIGDYRVQAKRLKHTGEGVRAADPGEVDTHNPVQYMQFYIPGTGPNEETSADGLNIWSAHTHPTPLLQL